jgi:hypothetical protein
MTIKEIETGADYVARYSRPKFATKDDELDWREQCKKDKETQTVLAAVSRSSSVETIRGTTLREFEEVTPVDIGGMVNLQRLAAVGVITLLTENQLGVNTGKYSHVFTRAVAHGSRIFDEGEGVEAEDLAVAAEDPYQAVDPQTNKVVTRHGRPAVDGNEKLRELVKLGFLREQKRRAKVAEAIAKATGRK